MSEECFICRKHQGKVFEYKGKVFQPGGVIYEDELIYVSHAQLWGDEREHYLGYVFVEPKRHVAELGDLTKAEAREIGLYTSRMAKGLMEVAGVEHVYSFVIGDGAPHVHVHVIGRYPGAPREFWGIKVDEWPNAPKGDADEIGRVAAQLRNFLSSGD